ncbi:hypothetical protein BKA82DRAFT_3387749 [Pisolithus tinctorius]|nr:hypothetical protein BKA82DRAFT_3387749 [Pisolithus tinctorius]
MIGSITCITFVHWCAGRLGPLSPITWALRWSRVQAYTADGSCSIVAGMVALTSSKGSCRIRIYLRPAICYRRGVYVRLHVLIERRFILIEPIRSQTYDLVYRTQNLFACTGQTERWQTLLHT